MTQLIAAKSGRLARHGGLIGRPEHDPYQSHRFRFSLEAAREMGIIKAAPPLPVSYQAQTRPWWNPALSQCDQMNLGACVDFTDSRYRETLSLQVHGPASYLRHSELWLYHEIQTKFFATQIGQDTGAYGAMGEVIIAGRGLAYSADYPGYPGSGYPYQDTTAALAANPPAKTFGPALWNKNIVPVQATTDQMVMMELLAAEHMVAVGYIVCRSMEEQAQGTGNVPLPQLGDTVLGSHENLRIGYVTGTTTYPNGAPLPAGSGGYWVHLNSWGSDPATWFSPENLLFVPFGFDQTPAPDGSGPCLMDAVAFALEPVGPGLR